MHNNINDCFGCKACQEICPKNAIKFVDNEKGFWLPYVDYNYCVSCGKCHEVCNLLHSSESLCNPMKVFAAWSNNEYVRRISSSGGIFYELAQATIGVLGGVVYASALLDMKVKHIRIDKECDIQKLIGSKYVQGDTNGSFSLVEKDLKSNITVLFVGTPCQVHGLHAYLDLRKCPKEKLISCDFVCHGAVSPAFWRKYIAFLENKANSRISNVQFRNKNSGWKDSSYLFEFQNGARYAVKNSDNVYHLAYDYNYTSRDVCSNCLYATIKRSSDITLGDFWQYSFSNENEDDENKGVSLVLVNTRKGEEMIESISTNIRLYEKTIDDALKGHAGLYSPHRKRNLYEQFWGDVSNNKNFIFLKMKYFQFRKITVWYYKILNRFKVFLHN